jgi:hypothetical protein
MRALRVYETRSLGRPASHTPNVIDAQNLRNLGGFEGGKQLNFAAPDRTKVNAKFKFLLYVSSDGRLMQLGNPSARLHHNRVDS